MMWSMKSVTQKIGRFDLVSMTLRTSLRQFGSWVPSAIFLFDASVPGNWSLTLCPCRSSWAFHSVLFPSPAPPARPSQSPSRTPRGRQPTESQNSWCTRAAVVSALSAPFRLFPTREMTPKRPAADFSCLCDCTGLSSGNFPPSASVAASPLASRRIRVSVCDACPQRHSLLLSS